MYSTKLAHTHCRFPENSIWTTRRDNSLEGVEIYLAFVGGVNFVTTIKDSYVMQDNREVISQNIFDLLCTAGTNNTNTHTSDGTVSTNDTNGTKDTNACTSDGMESINKTVSGTNDATSTKDTDALNLSTKDTSCTNETNVGTTDGTQGTKDSKKPVKKEVERGVVARKLAKSVHLLQKNLTTDLHLQLEML